MSRSRKKTPICGITTAVSDKKFKEAEHRRERRQIKAALSKDKEPDHPKEYGNPWASQKDGKQYWDDPKNYRK